MIIYLIGTIVGFFSLKKILLKWASEDGPWTKYDTIVTAIFALGSWLWLIVYLVFEAIEYRERSKRK